MKAKILAASIALAASSGAFAQNYQADVAVYAAGASAQIGQVTAIFQNSICQPNTVVAFTRDSSNARAVHCTALNSAELPASIRGKTVLFNYSALSGGSSSGVQYVARGLERDFIDVESQAVVAAPATINVPASVPTVKRVPVAGTSDVEPAMFRGVNAPDVGNVTDADLGQLEVAANRGVIFGLLANCNLVSALQQAQGIAPLDCSGANLANDLTDANRPSITSAQVRSLVSATVYDSSFLGVDPSEDLGKFDYHRRTAGSGTQATSNAVFLNAPCSDFGGTLADVGDYGYVEIFAHSSSSQVPTQVNNNTTGYAIGAVSLETAPRNNAGYLKINGVNPNRANVIRGAYEFYGEETFQIRTDATQDQKDLLAFYGSQAGSVDVLATLGSVSTSLVALPTATPSMHADPAVAAQRNADFIAKGTRSGNTCSPLYLF